MEDIILIGGGGHCRSVIDVIEAENKYRIVGIVDKVEMLGKKILGYKVVSDDKGIYKLAERYKYALITVGQIKEYETRSKLFEKAKSAGFIMPVVVSPRAYVSKHACIGEGTIVMHDAFVNVKAKVGRNVIINTKALIEHDCIVENNCHISTGAIVNGGVHVKKNSFIGSNAVVVQSAVIEECGFIKAGSMTA